MPNRGKVLTLLTLLIISSLSPYTTPCKFLKVLTSLTHNDLSHYINDIERPITFLLTVYDIREIENMEIEHRHHNSCKQDNKNSGPNEQ